MAIILKKKLFNLFYHIYTHKIPLQWHIIQIFKKNNTLKKEKKEKNILFFAKQILHLQMILVN